MATASPLRSLSLQFRPDTPQLETILSNLSAVRWVGPHLWLGSDEGGTLERVTPEGDTAVDHQRFPLRDYIDLPNPPNEEIDIEGLAYSDYYLWIVGSHSLKRKKPEADKSLAENLERMSTLSKEENRYTLCRIPLVDGQLFQACPHPEFPDQTLTAAQLKRKKTGNQLTHKLRDDPHLGPFLTADLPGKENGFDIEGVAVSGERLFVGLRGPVLRGWAVLLELHLKDKGSGLLKLKKMDDTGLHYRKYFLDLNGHGIRDLCFDGDDLLVLAGPTMDMAGLAEVFRLPHFLSEDQNQLLQPRSILDLLDKDHGDKAEGITLLPTNTDELLIAYDSPGRDRIHLDTASLTLDVFTLPQSS